MKIFSRILKIRVDELHDDISFEDAEHWDSLSHMDLITSLEQEFGFELSMDEVMMMTTVAAVKTVVHDKFNEC